MQQTPATESFIERSGSPVKYIFGFALLGMLLAMVYTWWITSEYSQNWKFIVQSPPGSVQFLGGNSSDIYVETEAGQIYGCALFTERECWIPNVLPPDMEAATSCDLTKPAFRASKMPTGEILSCRQITYAIPDGIETRFYVLNQNGEIWGWGQGSSAYGLVLYAAAILIGGLLGAFAGSLIWLGLALFNRHRQIQPWISMRQIILVAITGALAIFGVFVLLVPWLNSNPLPDATKTEDQLTQDEVPTLAPRTAAVDLIKLVCVARWKVGANDVPCPDDHVQEDAPYLLNLEDLNLEYNHLGDTALVMPLSSKAQFAQGVYSGLEIQPSDHFRATIGCLDTTEACEAVFEVGYVLPSDNKVVLGRWELSDDGLLSDIDINLENLVGIEVRLRLHVSTNSEAGNQLPFWINPVISP